MTKYFIMPQRLVAKDISAPTTAEINKCLKQLSGPATNVAGFDSFADAKAYAAEKGLDNPTYFSGEIGRKPRNLKADGACTLYPSNKILTKSIQLLDGEGNALNAGKNAPAAVSAKSDKGARINLKLVGLSAATIAALGAATGGIFYLGMPAMLGFTGLSAAAQVGVSAGLATAGLAAASALGYTLKAAYGFMSTKLANRGNTNKSEAAAPEAQANGNGVSAEMTEQFKQAANQLEKDAPNASASEQESSRPVINSGSISASSDESEEVSASPRRSERLASRTRQTARR